LLLAANSHKLSIHNCVLKNSVHNSVSIDLQHTGYSIEFYLTNITIVNGSNEGTLGGDIYIDARNESNHLVTIRDSYINSSRGNAISLHLQRGYLCQTIHVINTIIDKSAAGIYIHDYSSPGNEDTMIYPQIIIENCIIRNITAASDYRTIGYFGLLTFGELGHSHISVTLSNVSFENNQLSCYSGIELHEARRLELIDCRFVGNEGTSVTATDSTFKFSGTLSFVNNTAYQGGAMGFYGDSYMSVSLKKNTQIFFINNYAKHIGGAIYILENKRGESPHPLILPTEVTPLCFLWIVDIDYCSELNSKNLSLTFRNNTALNGGDAIYGGSCILVMLLLVTRIMGA